MGTSTLTKPKATNLQNLIKKINQIFKTLKTQSIQAKKQTVQSFHFELPYQRKEVASNRTTTTKKKNNMAAELKTEKIIEEMTKTSALEMVSNSDVYRQEEKKLTSNQTDEVRMERRWSVTQDDQFYDSKKCTIM